MEKADNVLKSGIFSWSSAIVVPVDVQEENIAIFQSIKRELSLKFWSPKTFGLDPERSNENGSVADPGCLSQRY